MKKENLHSRGMLCGGGANQPYCASRWRRFAAFFYSRQGSETMTFLRRGVYGVMSLWVAIFYFVLYLMASIHMLLAYSYD